MKNKRIGLVALNDILFNSIFPFSAGNLCEIQRTRPFQNIS